MVLEAEFYQNIFIKIIFKRMDINQLLKMHKLSETLQKGFVGTPDSLAASIGVSKSTMYRYLDDLRDYGAIIERSNNDMRYSMQNKFSFLETYLKSNCPEVLK